MNHFSIASAASLTSTAALVDAQMTPDLHLTT
jgi:hypothetical protein